MDSLILDLRHASRALLRSPNLLLSALLALALGIGAGPMSRGLATLRAVDPGFRAAGVLTVNVALPEAAYPEPPRTTAFFGDLLREVEALPGGESAGGASAPPRE